MRRFLRGGVSGTSGLSACCWDDRAHCRRLSRGVAREGGASWCVGDVLLCCGRDGVAAYGQVFLRRDRLGIVCSCARVLVCSCARVLVCSCARVLVCSCARVLVGTIDCTVGAGVPMQPFPKRRKWSSRRHTRRAVSLGSRVHALWWCRSLVRLSTRASDEYFKN